MHGSHIVPLENEICEDLSYKKLEYKGGNDGVEVVCTASIEMIHKSCNSCAHTSIWPLFLGSGTSLCNSLTVPTSHELGNFDCPNFFSQDSEPLSNQLLWIIKSARRLHLDYTGYTSSMCIDEIEQTTDETIMRPSVRLAAWICLDGHNSMYEIPTCCPM